MSKKENYDFLVIGAGFAGSVIAREMADKGKKVLVIEKRNHIGGNMYECFDDKGIRIHQYGPHIFHTKILRVFEYLKKYSGFYKYEHKVVGKIDGKLVPIPFNFKSLDLLFSKTEAENIKIKLKETYPDSEKVSILDLLNSDEDIIKKFGEYVFDKVFVNYTAKQWGIPVSEVDKSVINRVPVVFSYDENYFDDTIQYMPSDGYTKLFDNLLKNENIDILLNTNVLDLVDLVDGKTYFKGKEFTGIIVFTGAVDELLNYKYGKLPYRSLKLIFENYNKSYFQSNSVVNYPNEEDFTRITEFKYLTNQTKDGITTILKEYPIKYDVNEKTSDPYYPIINPENLDIYNKYKKDVDSYKNIYLLGRLAEYKYYNMDIVIDKALSLSDEIIMEDK